MICCKIITDFNNPTASFRELLEALARNGEVRWEQNNLLFADVTGSMCESKVKSIIKKAGYTKYYIDVYSRDNQPRETDDSVKSWLMDKITKITYKEFEQMKQDTFKETSKGLDQLEALIDYYKNKQTQDIALNNSSKEGD